jgi:hypothetical protein
MKPLVIYHAGCTDGIVAAWAVWKQLGDEAEYRAMNYGDPPPADVVGRVVIIVDFSFKRPDMARLRDQAVAMTTLDHHKSAKAELQALPDCHFDMERSGAGMAWDFFHQGKPRPWIVDYVEDRDLWRFKLPDSRIINNYLQVMERSIMAVEEACEAGVGAACAQGSAMQLAIDDYLERTRSYAGRARLHAYDVPCVNAGGYFVSELVGGLAEGQPFAFAWFQRADGKYIYSLRSRKGGVDVSEVAKQYGGGGHAQAAGFEVNCLQHVLLAPALLKKDS